MHKLTACVFKFYFYYKYYVTKIFYTVHPSLMPHLLLENHFANTQLTNTMFGQHSNDLDIRHLVERIHYKILFLSTKCPSAKSFSISLYLPSFMLNFRHKKLLQSDSETKIENIFNGPKIPAVLKL